MKYEPIETAPKDRTILVYNPIEGWYESQCHQIEGKRDEWPHCTFNFPGKGDLRIDPTLKPEPVINWPGPTYWCELPLPPK